MKNENTNRLLFYKTVSTEYEIQPYLKKITDIKHRKCLSKLRIGAHHLKIESGRQKGIVRENRKCTTCNVIEDEWHFLNTCVRFVDIRNELMRDIALLHPQFHTLEPTDLMLKVDVSSRLGQFVFDCFKKHRDTR